ncbi:MAG: hypothetical protein J6J65_10645 [Opitutales bacterium]|nr:hypothetical protein [Opitutales bacterium]
MQFWGIKMRLQTRREKETQSRKADAAQKPPYMAPAQYQINIVQSRRSRLARRKTGDCRTVARQPYPRVNLGVKRSIFTKIIS